MIKNYLKIALRNLKRYSAHSILNISGLAIGMACAILLFLWIQDELSYDSYFKDADNLYRVLESPNPTEGETPFAISSCPLASVLKQEYPEIIRSSRFLTAPLSLKKGDEYIEELVDCVDKDFLKMFNIEFIEGDMHTALDAPHNIVLTEEMAHKYFGNEDAIGKTLQSFDHIKTVTGIIKSVPRNSHIQINILVPFEWVKEMGVPVNEWWYRCYNYVELYKGTDSKSVDGKIRDVVKKYNQGWNAEIFLQNIKKIHLYSSRKYIYDMPGLGDIFYVRLMILIAVFILLTACINFMNLTTAQSSRRAKEIGLRKVAGANRRKIVAQFLGESLLIVLIAHVIAMILVELLLPAYKNFTGKQLAINYQSADLYIELISIILFCSLLAGSYPALYLSSLKPLDNLKGLINKKPGNARFRRALVIVQFSLSILLISCTLIIRKQLSYMQNKDLGYNKENIGYFMFPLSPQNPKLETIKKELSSYTDIVSVTRAHTNPLNNDDVLNDLVWRGKKKGDEVLFYQIVADMDYAETFQIKMLKGRYFSSEYATDSSAIVINERAAEAMGFKDPIGEIVTIYNRNCPIIGVVKDFHFKPLHYKIEPLIMEYRASNVFFIKMKPEHILSTVDFVEKTYKSFNPDLPFEFHFLDNDFNWLYWAERKLGQLFGYFSLLAIIISCLGLIGLSIFITDRRTKEIGIRKANGAKSVEIFTLLSKEYVSLVILSSLIAGPIGWFVMHNWLQNYAYRITIGSGVFILSSCIVLIIALLTISIQTYKAAGKNPVDALRYE
jgi:putative ABC transport system permease protein